MRFTIGTTPCVHRLRHCLLRTLHPGCFGRVRQADGAAELYSTEPWELDCGSVADVVPLRPTSCHVPTTRADVARRRDRGGGGRRGWRSVATGVGGVGNSVAKVGVDVASLSFLMRLDIFTHI